MGCADFGTGRERKKKTEAGLDHGLRERNEQDTKLLEPQMNADSRGFFPRHSREDGKPEKDSFNRKESKANPGTVDERKWTRIKYNRPDRPQKHD